MTITEDVLRTANKRVTPQSEKADPRQVRNDAGGYTFQVKPVDRLRRFLILGSQSGTYYAQPKELTKASADFLIDYARVAPDVMLHEIVSISQSGRAPKNDQALFALAILASTDDATWRRKAMDALPQVARTGTHLFQFVQYMEQFRGWGRTARNGVARWYIDKSVESAAYQMLKYQSRNGMSHRDVLRLSHPKTVSADRARLFDWTCGRGGDEDFPGNLRLIEGYQRAHSGGANVAALVKQYGLSWEMLPSKSLTDPKTWEAILGNGMPLGAMIRNLSRLTRLGILAPGSDYTRLVVDTLGSHEALKKARIHPLGVLNAMKAYQLGRAGFSDATWAPVRKVVDALDDAFYASFDLVDPTGRSHLLAVDVSGSMNAQIAGMSITAAEASMCQAMVTARVEGDCEIVAFTYDGGSSGGRWYGGGNSGLTHVDISPRERLDDIVRKTQAMTWGGTDCALPITDALKSRVSYDVCAVLTDNETWVGEIHPHQALKRYRDQVNPRAKMAVVAATSTGFTIADPRDSGMMDFVGMDTSTPALLADFAREG